MGRKASFSVQAAKVNSSNHNSRKQKPRYLIDENAQNDYILFHSDSEFLELAKNKYQETKNQKMQKKQIEALIKETVLSLEKHHTIDDVKKLFKELNEEYGGGTM